MTFDSTTPLTFDGDARRLKVEGLLPLSSNPIIYGFKEGAKLQIKSLDKARDSCELEAFIGPVHQGVSLGVWLYGKGSGDRIYMGTVRLAKPRSAEPK